MVTAPVQHSRNFELWPPEYEYKWVQHLNQINFRGNPLGAPAGLGFQNVSMIIFIGLPLKEESLCIITASYIKTSVSLQCTSCYIYSENNITEQQSARCRVHSPISLNGNSHILTLNLIWFTRLDLRFTHFIGMGEISTNKGIKLQ